MEDYQTNLEIFLLIWKAIVDLEPWRRMLKNIFTSYTITKNAVVLRGKL